MIKHIVFQCDLLAFHIAMSKLSRHVGVFPALANIWAFLLADFYFLSPYLPWKNPERAKKVSNKNHIVI